MRFNNKDFIKMYDMYYNQGLSFRRIGKIFKAQHCQVSLILKTKFNEKGELIEKGFNNKYSPDFKEMVVLEYLNNPYISLTDLVLKYNLKNMGTIHSWVSKYKEFGYNGLKGKQGRPSMKKKEIKEVKIDNKDISKESNNDDYEKLKEEILKLKSRNLYLEAENEFLKKLRALVQEKGKESRNKK